MKVVMGGARGSLPVSGADQVRYGGDTFAFLAEGIDGAQVLIDAGTGVRHLLPRLRPGSTLFFTHTHLDHLIGLPLLAAVWPQEMISPHGRLPEVLERVFSPPVWPVELPPACISASPPPVTVGGLQVSWQAVAHPDHCMAFRIDEPATGASVAIATDLEWPAMSRENREAFSRFAGGVDLLVFDAHFLPAEYATHKGWGHSTWADAVEAARSAGARKLWLMHHAPARTDAELDALAAEASAMWPAAVVPAVHAMEENLHE